jgi:hypothetical protein
VRDVSAVAGVRRDVEGSSPSIVMKMLSLLMLEASPTHQSPAIRQLVKIALSGSLSRPQAKKASELAAGAAERILDKSLPEEEQQRRKREVIKGPKEFRDIRQDVPKPRKDQRSGG